MSLALSVSLFSLHALSADIEKFKSDIVQLTTPRCTSDQAAVERREVQMAFLRGSPMDAMNAPQAGEDFLNLTRSVLESKNYQVHTMSAHHTSWRRICDAFKARAQAHVILVGHSYGSSGALKVANCLHESGVKTDLLITVSSFDLLAGVNVSRIPEHVKSHYNFFVRDPLIPGYREHTAINPERTSVKNVEARIDRGGWSHLAAAGELLPLLSLISSAQMTGQAPSVNIQSNVSTETVQNNLRTYWHCEPERTVAPVLPVTPASEEPVAPDQPETNS
jgi:hypothetical protein